MWINLLKFLVQNEGPTWLQVCASASILHL